METFAFCAIFFIFFLLTLIPLIGLFVTKPEDTAEKHKEKINAEPVICWNCEKPFIPFKYEEADEILTEDQFCCGECHLEWMSDNRYEYQ